MRDALYDLQFNKTIPQQPQSPAGISFGGSAAHQCDQMGFGLPVQPVFVSLTVLDFTSHRRTHVYQA